MKDLTIRIQKAFDHHGIKDSPMHVLLYAEIRATQLMLLQISSKDQAELDSAFHRLVELQSDSLIAALQTLYGEAVYKTFDQSLPAP